MQLGIDRPSTTRGTAGRSFFQVGHLSVDLLDLRKDLRGDLGEDELEDSLEDSAPAL